MRMRIVVLAIIVLILTLAGCGTASPSPTGEASTTTQSPSTTQGPATTAPPTTAPATTQGPTTPTTAPPITSTTGQSGEPGTITFTGTVVFKDFEGGFYAIDADDGSAYDPIDLPRQFAADGLRVQVTAKIRDDMVSFHMYGAIIEIVDISRL